jgi:hypothetical protein
VVIDNFISISLYTEMCTYVYFSIFMLVVVAYINRVWRKATDSPSLTLPEVSGDAARRTRQLQRLSAASSDMMAAPDLCVAMTRGEKVAIVMCGKHTIVRLQMNLQAFKQLGQNDFRNIAKFVVGN